MISHFAAFNLKEFSSVNFYTVATCASSDDGLEASVRMSSACKKEPAYMLLTIAPMNSDWGCLKRGSMNSKNRADDKMDPCCTPPAKSKWGRYMLSQEYWTLTVCVLAALLSMPSFWINTSIKKYFRRTWNSTESNTFWRWLRHKHPAPLFTISTDVLLGGRDSICTGHTLFVYRLTYLGVAGRLL